MLRPGAGYPQVTLPPAAMARYGLPGAVPPTNFPASAAAAAAAYTRQTAAAAAAVQADPRNPRLQIRAPYGPFMGQDGVQLIGVGGPPNSLLASSAHATISTILGPDLHGARRPRPVPDARQGSGAPAGGPTAPLTIETRETKENAGYQPQVEAISPTPEDRPAERDDIKSTKDHLLQKIAKVDREIAKAESQIAKLKKKQEELEDAANKPSTDSASEDEKPNQSIAQNVYSENRRKAGQSHAMLNKFSPGNLLPLYNQPSDTELYNKNKKEYTVFKKQLVEYFKRKNEEQESRDREMTVTYCKLSSAWTRKVDRRENSKKRREREAKSREMYEKLFPELRKQREDKERNERLGTRGTVRSDQEIQDVIDKLQEDELEEKKMHSYAVVPPPLLPPEDRKRKYIDNNGLMADPLLVYNERKFVNMWTDAEKDTFKEKYLQHPKNFCMIAQYLERKSVSDCVQYYYLSKKTENYKQMLRKPRRTGGNRQSRRVNPPTGEVIAPGIPGVVTRRTVNALQEKEGVDSKGVSRSNTPQPTNKDKDGDDGTNGEKETGRPRRNNAGKKAEPVESSDDEDSNQAVKCGPFPCVVCKTTVESSRPVTKAQATQLGVKEDDITENSRVCSTCWCKTLRTKCPLLSCSSASKSKKLRHLPAKWKELSAGLKEVLSNELQIPEGTKQVCTTCFSRINKRISQAQDDETLNLDKNAATPRDSKETYKVGDVVWSAEDVAFLEMVLRTEGKDWAKVASKVPEKSASECKKFFYAHRKKLDLDTLVAEYKKSVGGGNAGDKPSLSSDEEYSTSSCDDEEKDKKKDGKVEEKSITNTIVDETKVSNTTTTTSTDMNNSTTTTTTNSTTVNNSVGGPKKDVDGYDSAATVSADETHEQDKKHHLPGGIAAAGHGSHLPPPSLPPHTTSTLVSTAPGGATVVNIGLPTTSASMGMGGKPPVPTSAAAFMPPSHMDMQQQGPQHNLKQIMDNVIDVSLKRPMNARQFSGEVSTIKDLLKDQQNPSLGLPPGFGIKPPPDLEVKPVPAPPPSGPSPSAAVVVEDSGVLNLTTTKRDRSPQPPPSHTSLSEPMYRSSFIERGPPNLPGHHPTVNKGEKPPEAHKDSTKTTHREMMDIENKRLKDFNEAVNHLAPSRQEMLSPYHKSYNTPGGSITRGQPIQPPNQHPGRASSSYHPVSGGPQMKSLSSSQPRGSLVTGTPVYTERNAMNSNDARNAQALDIMKKHQQAQQQQQQQQQQSQVSRYPQFSGRQPPPGPPSHDSRGSTSRRVIENDFLTAQSLPRKDTHEDLRSPYARVDHRDRDIQIVEAHPRFDPRPNIYGNPRGPHPYGPIRTDPKADIPPRGDPTIRTDPRADLRADLHAPSADPRAFQADPRARPGAYPGYPGSMSRDTRPRSPPRSVPTSRPGMPGGSIMTRPGQAGLPSGVPRNSIEIHRQPEVSITKQTRPDYPNTALANFADIALQQPKLTDLTRQQQGGGLGAANSGPGTSSSLTVTRTTDPNAARVQDMRNFALNALKQQYDPRYMTPEQQQKLIESMNEAEREKLRYSQQPGNRHISTDQLIDLIVSNQIKNNIGQPSAANLAANLANLPPNLQAQYGLTSLVAAGGLPRMDGKESPSKQPSRSPLVKEGLDEARAMMMRTSPAGGLPQSTLDHMERMKTEVQKNRTSPYPMLPTTASAADMHEYWKRGKFPPGVDPAAYMQRPPSQGSHSGSLPRPNSTGMPAPSNMGTSDERQIIRVAQNASPRSDKGSLGGGRPAIEAISPPTSDPSRSTPNYPNYTDVNSIHRFLASQQRKPEGFDQNSTQILDYIKRKIDEGMKNDMVDHRNLGQPANLTMGPPNKRPLDNNDRGMGGPSNSGPADLSESPRKRHKMDEGGNSQDLPDSPGSGEMVIDESARPDSAHSQKTTSPAPHPSDYSAYRGGLPPGSGNLPQMPPRSSPSGGMPNYGALNASRGGPPPPATSSGPSGPPPQSQLPPPTGGAPPGARYEPLSDDD